MRCFQFVLSRALFVFLFDLVQVSLFANRCFGYTVAPLLIVRSFGIVMDVRVHYAGLKRITCFITAQCNLFHPVPSNQQCERK